MNSAFDFLMTCLYDHALHPDHRADLRKSGLTDETITLQKIRTMPPSMIGPILGFETPKVVSAYLLPFPAPGGGWMDHVRVKVFPSYTSAEGRTVKYLGPRNDGPRPFFPIATMAEACRGSAPLWICEGAKKSLAVAQLGLPAIGFEGIQGWHRRGSRDLLPDFDLIALKDRVVELVPDGDWRTNPEVARGAEQLAMALEARGARVRIVALPETVAA
jgi:hypothetical protein